LSDVARRTARSPEQLADLGARGPLAADADMRVLDALLRSGMVPVVASIGVDRADGS
jgi:acetylglutamate kinase